MTMSRTKDSVVACYSLNGKLVKVYPSARKAAESRHLFPRTIDRCIRGDVKTVKGLQWKRFDFDEVPDKISPLVISTTSVSIKPIAKVDENGVTIEAYPSIRSASIKNNIDPHTLRDILNKKYAYAGKAKFRYLTTNEIDKYNFKIGKKIDTQTKGIVQLEMDGKYIKTYPSIRAALKALNKPLSSQAISECLKGKYSSAYGYRWKYKDGKLTTRIKKKKYIYALSSNFEVVKKYDSVRDAASELSVSVSAINNAIRLCKKARGYYWNRS